MSSRVSQQMPPPDLTAFLACNNIQQTTLDGGKPVAYYNRNKKAEVEVKLERSHPL